MNPDLRKPLVSVVVPVYNHVRYIERCLDSVFGQTHRPLQLIIIDDGSKDGSAEVIEDYLRRRGDAHGVEVIFRARENRGAHETINEGVKAATGEFVSVLNSDDFYHPRRIEKCLRACDSAKVDLVFTYVEPVGDDGEALPVTHPWHRWYDATCHDELFVAPTTGFVLLGGNIAVSSGNLFLRRGLFAEMGLFGDYVIAHDLEFLLRALLVTEPFLIKEKLYYYRLHGANTFYTQGENTEAELERIYASYIRSAAAAPPRNTLAPCHWYWSASYQRYFSVIPRLGRALDSLLAAPPDVPARASDGWRWRGAASPAGQHAAQSITLVTHELTLTGAPKVMLEVAAMLLAHGVDVNLISVADGPLRKSFEQHGVPVKVLQTRFMDHLADSIDRRVQRGPGGGYTMRFLELVGWTARRAAWAFPKLGIMFDVPFLLNLLRAAFTVRRRVLVNSFAAWPVVIGLAKVRSFDRMLWFIHESYDPNLLLQSNFSKTAFSRLLREPWLRFAFGSEATRAIWSGAGVEGVVRYWSGLPRDAYLDRRASGTDRIRSLLSVGNSSHRKGTRLLMEAFALARREGWLPDDVTLTIVGVQQPSRFPYAADLVLRAQRSDIVDRVFLVPSVESDVLEDYYEHADLYIQSSTSECLPLALLTAMAFGLPIVTTDVDGCKEAISDGVSGRTVAPRGVAVLAKAIADAVADPARSRAFGEAARRTFVDRFSLEATEAVLLESILA